MGLAQQQEEKSEQTVNTGDDNTGFIPDARRCVSRVLECKTRPTVKLVFILCVRCGGWARRDIKNGLFDIRNLVVCR